MHIITCVCVWPGITNLWFGFIIQMNVLMSTLNSFFFLCSSFFSPETWVRTRSRRFPGKLSEESPMSRTCKLFDSFSIFHYFLNSLIWLFHFYHFLQSYSFLHSIQVHIFEFVKIVFSISINELTYSHWSTNVKFNNNCTNYQKSISLIQLSG